MSNGTVVNWSGGEKLSTCPEQRPASTNFVQDRSGLKTKQFKIVLAEI
jgi:hypothetical protein